MFDEYRKDSLKAATREKRGSGQRRRVLQNALIPCDWNEFLRVDKNKTELFRYLSCWGLTTPLAGLRGSEVVIG